MHPKFKMSRPFPGVAAALAMAAALPGPAGAAAPAPAPPTAVAAPTSFADVADYAVESATIVDAFIRRATPLDATRAPNLPAGIVRIYIEADVQAVIYGREPVARSVSYLVDVPRLANGRPPRLSRQRVLLFARPVVNASQLQLVRTTAQLAWSEGHAMSARAIATELARGDVPPQVTGVAQAFHVRGTVTGESETQIFLRTANAQPVSLTILRRPGQAPRWAAAFGEIVDESAAVPARRTLGWYRLACGLPRRVPAEAVAGVSAEDVAAIAADYAIVTASVGSCDRSPPAPVPVAVPPRR